MACPCGQAERNGTHFKEMDEQGFAFLSISLIIFILY